MLKINVGFFVVGQSNAPELSPKPYPTTILGVIKEHLREQVFLERCDVFIVTSRYFSLENGPKTLNTICMDALRSDELDRMVYSFVPEVVSFTARNGLISLPHITVDHCTRPDPLFD
jgi:hypothetical protein